MECPSAELLESILHGPSPSNVSVAEVEAHLEQCESCQHAILRRSGDAAWRRLYDGWQTDQSEDTHLVASADETQGFTSQTNQVQALNIPGYDVGEQIGQGGMAVVFRARHRRLDRDVALKVLVRSAVSGPGAWLRFQTEAQAVARLQHPNIIQVFDSGEVDGGAFVCQELADGGTLEQRINHTPQPVDESAQLVCTLARAVAHAHREGVLHRDVKPSNVLFSRGVAKLADFGLAKLLDDNQAVTQSADVMGTPRYMAPEQAESRQSDVGKATDVYAMGVILYEMLSGATPFHGSTPVAIIRQIVDREPVFIRHQNPDVPKDLATICHKCLEKEPSKRYRSADGLADDLQRFLDRQPVLARPTPWWERTWKWCRRRPASAALVSVIVVAATTLLSVWAVLTQQLAVQTTLAQQKAEEARTSLAAEQDARGAATDVLSFMSEEVFDAATPRRAMDHELTMVEALSRAGDTIAGRFDDRPAVEATLRTTIGNALYGLGKPLAALPHLEKAVQLVGAVDVGADTTFKARQVYALCLKDIARADEARAELESLLEAEWLTPPQRLDARLSLSNILLGSGSPTQAMQFLEDLVADSRDVLGEYDPKTMIAVGNLAVAVFQTGDTERAAELFQQSHEMRVQQLGPDHPDSLNVAHNLAFIYVQLGKLDEAEALHRDTLQRRVRILGPDHGETLGSKHAISRILQRRGQHAEAAEMMLQVLKTQAAMAGNTSDAALQTMHSLANVYSEMDDATAAVQFMEEWFDPIASQQQDTEHWGALYLVYGRIHRAAGDEAAAQEMLTTARQIFESAPHVRKRYWEQLAEHEQ